LDLLAEARESGKVPPEVLMRYGQTLASLGAFEQGQPVLAQATGGQTNTPAQASLNNVAQALKALNGLQQQLATVVQKDPTGPDALRLRAQMLELTGHNLQATYLLESLLARNPA